MLMKMLVTTGMAKVVFWLPKLLCLAVFHDSVVIVAPCESYPTFRTRCAFSHFGCTPYIFRAYLTIARSIWRTYIPVFCGETVNFVLRTHVHLKQQQYHLSFSNDTGRHWTSLLQALTNSLYAFICLFYRVFHVSFLRKRSGVKRTQKYMALHRRFWVHFSGSTLNVRISLASFWISGTNQHHTVNT